MNGTRPPDNDNALGNTGNPETLPVIRERLATSDPLVRASAIASLRHMQGEQVNELLALASACQTDADEAVRQTAYMAIQSLDQRYPGLLQRGQ